MAYDQSKLDKLSFCVNPSVPNWKSYKNTNDTLAQIREGGYFIDPFLKVDDVIYVVGSDGSTLLQVISVDPVTTASIFEKNDIVMDDFINVLPVKTRGFQARHNSIISVESPIEGCVFAASFKENLDADYGNGSLTVTPSGGAAISGGMLDLAHSDARYVDINNTASLYCNRGCVTFDVYIPYGSVHAPQAFFISQSDSINLNDSTQLFHFASNQLRLRFYSATAALPFDLDIGEFIAEPGKTYKFELGYNFDGVGEFYVFINGNLFYSNVSFAVIRNVAPSQYTRIGRARSGAGSTYTSNFKMSNLMFFRDILHRETYPLYPVDTIYSQDIGISEALSQFGDTHIKGGFSVVDTKSIGIDISPSFYAKFDKIYDANYSVGTTTRTGRNGPGDIDGKLGANLSRNGVSADQVRYVRWGLPIASLGFSPMQLVGTAVGKYTFAYTGAPSSTQCLLSVGGALGGGVANMLALLHDTNGDFALTVIDYAGVGIINYAILGRYLPTAGNQVEVELTMDLVNGYTLIRINGSQIGNVITDRSYNRTDIGNIYIGVSPLNTSLLSNFYIKDFAIYPNVRHTSNYTPGYELPDTPPLMQNTKTGLHNLYAGGNLGRTVAVDVIAFATGGQANATRLSADYTVIKTCATAGDSVALLACPFTAIKEIKNSGAQSCNVYPNTGDYMNGTINAAYALAAGATARFLQTQTTATPGITYNTWVTL